MNKRNNGLWIVILLLLTSLTAFSQDSVTLDIRTVNGIIDDLILFDAAKVELVKKDSIILIYKHKDEINAQQIIEYKLNEQEYKKVIAKKDELIAFEKAKNKDLKKQLRRTRIKAIITIIAITTVTIIAL